MLLVLCGSSSSLSKTQTVLPIRCSCFVLSIADRQISMLHFSQVQKHTMLSVHMPTTKPRAKHLDSCTIICIWNIWEPSRPQKILVYESEVTFTTFSIQFYTISRVWYQPIVSQLQSGYLKSNIRHERNTSEKNNVQLRK